MRVGLYARFSSDLQNERSIDDQVAACQRLLDRHGWAAAEIYADRAISGASMATRPDLQRMLADVRARRIDVVVAEAIDRLSRDQADIALIHRAAELAGAKIITLSEGEVGLLQIGLAGTMAHMFLKQLGDKTRRGLEGRVRLGRSGGGRCYGYALAPGDVGARVIVEAEAEVVRGIYRDYAQGVSPRAIAARLNRDGVAGPTGRGWTAAAINGDRRAGDGILCNALYRGELVFNRRRFVKDPETGRRRGLLRPESEWLRTPVPDLRIVDDETWEAVQRRRASLAWTPAANRGKQIAAGNRPRRLLSGLIACGGCGGRMTVVTRAYYGCSAARERGDCSNRKLVAAAKLDARVVGGLKRHLLTPSLVAEAVRAYHAELKRLRSRAHSDTRAIARRLEEARRQAVRIADMLVETGPSPTLVAKLKDAEAAVAQLEADAQRAAPPKVAVHPGAAELYRVKVAELERALAGGDLGADTLDSVRDLIERIVVTPDAEAVDGLAVVVEGRLAALLGHKDAPGVSAGGVSAYPMAATAALGAGAGFEPTTFRL